MNILAVLNKILIFSITKMQKFANKHLNIEKLTFLLFYNYYYFYKCLVDLLSDQSLNILIKYLNSMS